MLPDMKTCPNCGSTNFPYAKNCANCGEPLPTAPDAPAPPAATPLSPQPPAPTRPAHPASVPDDPLADFPSASLEARAIARGFSPRSSFRDLTRSTLAVVGVVLLGMLLLAAFVGFVAMGKASAKRDVDRAITLYFGAPGQNVDRAKAFEILEKNEKKSAAARGPLAWALFHSGDFGVAPDYPRAHKVAEGAAKSEDALGLYALADAIRYGRGCEPDFDASHELYKRAVAAFEKLDAKGDPLAPYFLGECYLKGKGVFKDPKKAFDDFARADELGVADATFRLGECYVEQVGLDLGVRDLQKGLSLCVQAGNRGLADALCRVAIYSRDGVGGDQNFKRAAEALQKAVEMGSAKGTRLLGDEYRRAAGMAPSVAAWIELEKVSSNGGSQSLALRMDRATFAEKARELLEKAASLGDTTALYDLGLLYERGVDGRSDRKRAEEYYSQAAELNDTETLKYLVGPSFSPVALTSLREERLNLLEKLSNQGELNSRDLSSDFGVSVDEERLSQWFRRAAETGDPEAMRAWGERLVEGRGAETDVRKGLEWLQEAADRGDGIASARCRQYKIQYGGGLGL